MIKKAMELSLLCDAKVLLIIEDIETNKKEVYSSEENARDFIGSLNFEVTPLHANKDVSLLWAIKIVRGLLW